MNVGGDYNIENSLAAINTGLKLGMTEDEIQKGLKKYHPIEKRWEAVNAGGFEIINDSYNANPESMRAFVDTVFELYKSYALVLADMGELGEDEVRYHMELGEYINNHPKLSPDADIISIGSLSEYITNEVNKVNSRHFSDIESAAEYIRSNVSKQKILFLKGSRSMKLEGLITALS